MTERVLRRGGRNTTEFSPGDKVSEINITFHTGSSDLTWGCGCNK
ncbi:MAG TPA: hypothetical protein VK993_15080 [Chthoniobacterales bacterium]|nr:hypothetical protein [Chthoniobacterales bacterium]